MKNLNLLAHIYIQCSYKNTIISLTDNNNKILKQWSTKSLKKTILKKNSPYNIERITYDCIFLAKKKNFKILNLYLKGKGKGRYNVIKHLKQFFKILLIKDTTTKSFNGCRPPKKKRR